QSLRIGSPSTFIAFPEKISADCRVSDGALLIGQPCRNLMRKAGEPPMATIDYEAEYNNRARVPEHAEIFARWERDAEDYRTEAMKERRAELGLAYGSTRRQRPARAVHPRRLLALPRSLDVQPRGARAQCTRRDGRGRRLRSLPGGYRR